MYLSFLYTSEIIYGSKHILGPKKRKVEANADPRNVFMSKNLFVPKKLILKRKFGSNNLWSKFCYADPHQGGIFPGIGVYDLPHNIGGSHKIYMIFTLFFVGGKKLLNDWKCPLSTVNFLL